MVKVREDLTRDADAWLLRLRARTGIADLDAAMDMLGPWADLPCEAWDGQTNCLQAGMFVVDVLAELRIDHDTLWAGLLFPTLRQLHFRLPEGFTTISTGVRSLIDGLAKISPLDELSLTTPRLLASESKQQADNVRRLLVAMIDDVRVPVVQLAERTAAIRAMRNAADLPRRRVAQQALEVFAPLAHRLGIGQLRWELEDYAFRYLETAAYKRIAHQLDERREERERFLQELIDELQRVLQEAGVAAEVTGRVKHLYGIWRKMQRKGVEMHDIYDVRAVRVLVKDVASCYSALGVVHTRWRHIPHEFDDYVANPKVNGYQSLHTAVIGPENKVVEVQIRTTDMHLDAELGVCAHWTYKDGGAEPRRGYDDKLEWLRTLLTAQDGRGVLEAFGEELNRQFADERIYLFTPSGDVVDLQAGATPLDFAYRIHTRVGDRCYGAKVDGRYVQLNTTLLTGQHVEILTRHDARPRREWLNENLNYVTTGRAKEKIRSYFRRRLQRDLVEEGRRLLFAEFARWGIWAPLEQLTTQMGYESAKALFVDLASGQQDMNSVVALARRLDPQGAQLDLLPSAQVVTGQRLRAVGNLPMAFASCCQPRAGDDVVGLIRRDVVTVHRRDCARVDRLRLRHGTQPIGLEWEASEYSQRFDVKISAYDRSGLLADIATIFAQQGINLVNSRSEGDVETGIAIVSARIEIDDANRLQAISHLLSAVPNVRDVEVIRVD